MCKRCGKTFSEDQPLSGIRTDTDTVTKIIHLLSEGMGIRPCARYIGCHTSTVLNVLVEVGLNLERFLDGAIRDIECQSLQLDELWARVGMKQSNSGAAPDLGDIYTYLAVDADTKLILAYHTGKRAMDDADIFLDEINRRVVGKFHVTTDAWRGYQERLPRHLGERATFATLHKTYKNQLGEDVRRYAAPICTGVHVRVRIGHPDPILINTSYVERTNLSVRHFTKRFSRLTLGYSRKLANHRQAVTLFVATYNFCKKHRTLDTSPAVQAGLTDHVWTVEELIGNACATNENSIQVPF